MTTMEKRSRGMTNREHALIAQLLGDGGAPAATAAWLESAVGRRERAAYARTLNLLRRAYGSSPVVQPRGLAFYTIVSTPIGRLLVARTAAGLARISFRRSEASVIADLRRRLGAEVIKTAAEMADIVMQLEAYFAGQRREFDLPIDFSTMTSFQRRVLQAARAVPAGRVVSYGNIAKRIGKPAASRAVGQALGHNPIPIVLPCHRVVASDGGLGGYTGGLAIKRKLLALEAAAL